MAQPSVAREPSMEEILASIRRIIESNDPESAKLDSASLPPVYEDEDGDDDLALAIDDAAPAMYAANDRGGAVPSVQTAAPEPVEKPSPKSVSLADLAARVRSSNERVEPVVGRSVETPLPVSPVMTSRMAELRSSMPQVEPERKVVQHAAEPADTFIAPNAPADVVVETLQPVAPQGETESKALVSAETREQVARSFGELAEAIDGSQRRSLDEMAEEMLRPMLQEWLDDNLPTLVERLVREEIERVARGPRR